MFRKSFVTAAAIAAVTLGALATSAPSFSQQAQPGRGGAGRGGAAAQAAPVPTGKAPVVRITGGQVQGVLYNDVAVYRGLPYAAPPVGNLRWRAPQPVRAWTGVKDASTNGSTCANGGVEDCLYLSVWKPADLRPGQKVPVMVWIHGGAFTGGSGGSTDGSQFTRKGVIVVTINYRLGRTGWFAHPAITKNLPAGEAPTNWGLMDQIAALQWVQNNIAAFGGDKNNVTAFGESAGAISVNYLMITREAHGLFDKAISESGFGRNGGATLANAERTGATYFEGKGITGDSAATLAAMRAVPYADLQGGLGLGAAGFIIDGKLVPMTIDQGFAAGRQAKVPFMLGGNSNEASLFASQNPNPAGRLAAITANRDQLLATYDPTGARDPARIINALVTDNSITEPDRNLARIHTRAGQPVYRYFFSYVGPAQRNGPGLGHGGEIGYVFGRSAANPEDFATSQAANAYWASFAKYSDPGAAGGVTWPRYTLSAEPVLEFGVAGPAVRNGLYNARLDWMENNRVAFAQSARAGAAPAAGAAAPAAAGRGGAAAPPAAGRGGAAAGGRGGAGRGAGRGATP